jgi:hypothetical protein
MITTQDPTNIAQLSWTSGIELIADDEYAKLVDLFIDDHHCFAIPGWQDSWCRKASLSEPFE